MIVTSEFKKMCLKAKSIGFRTEGGVSTFQLFHDSNDYFNYTNFSTKSNYDDKFAKKCWHCSGMREGSNIEAIVKSLKKGDDISIEWYKNYYIFDNGNSNMASDGVFLKVQRKTKSGYQPPLNFLVAVEFIMDKNSSARMIQG